VISKQLCVISKELYVISKELYVISKDKYKEASKKELVNSLYSLLPETKDTQHAREQTQLHSEKSYKEQYNREKGKSSFSSMRRLPEVDRAMEVAKNQSDVSYRKGKEELHRYNSAADRPDIVNAANAAKLASNVRVCVCHALRQWQFSLFYRLQVKYKESFDRDLKGQRPHYNPLDCLSFKHTQAAAALASQVEYKKKHKETKAQYHTALDSVEQLLHKENALLHSQVKYREEYKRSKGRSQMEFGDTQMYKVSKEAQRMQSEVKLDYEEQVKGKSLMDVDQTPGYLTACHASSLLSEKKYKDEAERLKGRSLASETPEMERVKANQKHISSVSLFLVLN
uniref:Nebulette n=1 Tax=Cyclopterus lumpus TaxID=8103 RepID=A0A8C2Z643_CYCLU